MAMIDIRNTFTVIPEGVYIFKIASVNYKENFGKMEVNLETADGKKHSERYSLMSKDGGVNQGAMAAFAFLAKAALNDFDRTEIDEQELVGHYIKGTITHDVHESNTKPGQTVTFAHLRDLEPADGFEGAEVPSPAPAQSSPASYDLASILG